MIFFKFTHFLILRQSKPLKKHTYPDCTKMSNSLHIRSPRFVTFRVMSVFSVNIRANAMVNVSGKHGTSYECQQTEYTVR